MKRHRTSSQRLPVAAMQRSSDAIGSARPDTHIIAASRLPRPIRPLRQPPIPPQRESSNNLGLRIVTGSDPKTFPLSSTKQRLSAGTQTPGAIPPGHTAPNHPVQWPQTPHPNHHHPSPPSALRTRDAEMSHSYPTDLTEIMHHRFPFRNTLDIQVAADSDHMDARANFWLTDRLSNEQYSFLMARPPRSIAREASRWITTEYPQFHLVHDQKESIKGFLEILESLPDPAPDHREARIYMIALLSNRLARLRAHRDHLCWEWRDDSPDSLKLLQLHKGLQQTLLREMRLNSYLLYLLHHRRPLPSEFVPLPLARQLIPLPPRPTHGPHWFPDGVPHTVDSPTLLQLLPRMYDAMVTELPLLRPHTSLVPGVPPLPVLQAYMARVVHDRTLYRTARPQHVPIRAQPPTSRPRTIRPVSHLAPLE